MPCLPLLTVTKVQIPHCKLQHNYKQQCTKYKPSAANASYPSTVVELDGALLCQNKIMLTIDFLLECCLQPVLKGWEWARRQG